MPASHFHLTSDVAPRAAWRPRSTWARSGVLCLAGALLLSLAGCAWLPVPWWNRQGPKEDGVRTHVFYWPGPGRSEPVRVRVVEHFQGWSHSRLEMDAPEPLLRVQGQMWMQVGCRLMQERREAAFTLERDALDFSRVQMHFYRRWEAAQAEVTPVRAAFTHHHCLANSLQF